VGRYVADFVVDSKVIVETKVARSIDTSHRDQTLNYLHASKLEVGLVLNFGTSPQFRRVVMSRNRQVLQEPSHGPGPRGS
jgi:GxxExxY protein